MGLFKFVPSGTLSRLRAQLACPVYFVPAAVHGILLLRADEKPRLCLGNDVPVVMLLQAQSGVLDFLGVGALVGGFGVLLRLDTHLEVR